jgi:hypothetical protein
MVRRLNAEIPSLTRAEVIVKMAQIVAVVGDGHTNIYPARDPKIGFHTLPVEFSFFGDELYIRANSRSSDCCSAQSYFASALRAWGSSNIS